MTEAPKPDQPASAENPDEQPPATPPDAVEPTAPNMRTFSLNSREFYEAVCGRRERPWIPNGALPRDPPARDLPVIVEPRRR